MERKNLFGRFPESIEMDDAGDHCYIMSENMYAVFGEEQIGCDIVSKLESPAVTIYSGRPSDELLEVHGTAICPVYQVDGRGAAAVPTGLVLVRVEEEKQVEEIREELDAAGYLIETTLTYAPHAGWIKSKSGEIVDSLINLDKLKSIPNLVHIEPQMVQVAVRK